MAPARAQGYTSRMSDTWDEGGNPWIVKGMTHAFENDWFRIDEHDVIRPDGVKGYYGVIRGRRLAGGVLPIDAAGCGHLVRQWRVPVGGSFLGNARGRR